MRSGNPQTPRPIDIRDARNRWGFWLRSKRILWQYIFHPIFWIIPGVLSGFKVILLRCWGAEIGHGVLIRQRVKVLMPWNLRVGDAVAFGTGANIYNFGVVVVGSQVVVSQDVFLCTGSHDIGSRNLRLIYRPIRIGSYAWIASGAFIGPGVTIEEGAVVAARAVVIKDVPSWVVVGGNPAKFIKQRTIEA